MLQELQATNSPKKRWRIVNDNPNVITMNNGRGVTTERDGQTYYRIGTITVGNRQKIAYINNDSELDAIQELLYNANKKMKKEEQILVEQRRKESEKFQKENEFEIKRLTETDTREVIKSINRALKGRIQGESNTTNSIYSQVQDKRVRVSKHHAVAVRSQSDIEVVIDLYGFWVNGSHYKTDSEDMTSEIIEEVKKWI